MVKILSPVHKLFMLKKLLQNSSSCTKYLGSGTVLHQLIRQRHTELSFASG